MIIDGRKIAEEIIFQLKKEFDKFENLSVMAIAVGDSPSAFSFLKQKQRIAEKLGIELKICKISSEVFETDLKKQVEDICMDENNKAVILQLPLPEKFDTDNVIQAISQEKDVDGLKNQDIVLSPASQTVKTIFEKYNIDYKSAKIVLIGFGRLVGKPIGDWLSRQNIKFDIVDKQTIDFEKEKLISSADILISGVGKAGVVPAKFVKQASVVIDFGFDYKDGKILGDVEQSAAEKAKLFTPTPGGTGPILTASIFKNFLSLLNRL